MTAPKLPDVSSLIKTYRQVFLSAGNDFLLDIPEQASIEAAVAAGAFKSFPYWSKVWPAARALSIWLNDHPEEVRGKCVLEIAAGIGLPGFTAGSLGAQVVVSDYIPEAVELLRQNARQQSFPATVARLDWRHPETFPEASVWLLSDVAYDPASFADLEQLIKYGREQHIKMILATPQRMASIPFLERIFPYTAEQHLYTIGESDEEVLVAVWII